MGTSLAKRNDRWRIKVTRASGLDAGSSGVCESENGREGVMASRTLQAARSSATAPPPDAVVARGVGEPQQQIAMTSLRCAEADEVAAAQLVERPQEVMLVAQPALVLRNDGGAVAIRADAERISPFATAADIDGLNERNARKVRVSGQSGNGLTELLSLDRRV